jgi:hypothetical protein
LTFPLTLLGGVDEGLNEKAGVHRGARLRGAWPVVAALPSTVAAPASISASHCRPRAR